jgi:hypothetical protein
LLTPKMTKGVILNSSSRHLVTCSVRRGVVAGDGAKKEVPMKKSHALSLTLSVAVTILLCPFAFAGTPQAQKIAPVDVVTAASAVPLALQDAISLSDEEILGVASPAQMSVHALSLHGLSIVAQNEVEGPETEGPDDDGPGGPDHEFEGEESGGH